MRFIKRDPLKGTWDEPSMLKSYRQTGELEILGALYEKYMPLVFGLCLNYLKDEETCKDAVMQIFEQLVTKLRIHEVTNFKSWLFTLSRNHCLMQLRSAERHPTVPLDENMENEAFSHLIESAGDKENRLRSMEKCIESLPAEQRSTIELFYLQQKCYKEIVEISGYDMNKVKSYIQNGKRNLKICMGKNNDEQESR